VQVLVALVWNLLVIGLCQLEMTLYSIQYWFGRNPGVHQAVAAFSLEERS
jgi:hypothetical protein